MPHSSSNLQQQLQEGRESGRSAAMLCPIAKASLASMTHRWPPSIRHEGQDGERREDDEDRGLDVAMSSWLPPAALFYPSLSSSATSGRMPRLPSMQLMVPTPVEAATPLPCLPLWEEGRSSYASSARSTFEDHAMLLATQPLLPTSPYEGGEPCPRISPLSPYLPSRRSRYLEYSDDDLYKSDQDEEEEDGEEDHDEEDGEVPLSPLRHPSALHSHPPYLEDRLTLQEPCIPLSISSLPPSSSSSNSYSWWEVSSHPSAPPCTDNNSNSGGAEASGLIIFSSPFSSPFPLPLVSSSPTTSPLSVTAYTAKGGKDSKEEEGEPSLWSFPHHGHHRHPDRTDNALGNGMNNGSNSSSQGGGRESGLLLRGHSFPGHYHLSSGVSAPSPSSSPSHSASSSTWTSPRSSCSRPSGLLLTSSPSAILFNGPFLARPPLHPIAVDASGDPHPSSSSSRSSSEFMLSDSDEEEGEGITELPVTSPRVDEDEESATRLEQATTSSGSSPPTAASSPRRRRQGDRDGAAGSSDSGAKPRGSRGAAAGAAARNVGRAVLQVGGRGLLAAAALVLVKVTMGGHPQPLPPQAAAVAHSPGKKKAKRQGSPRDGRARRSSSGGGGQEERLF